MLSRQLSKDLIDKLKPLLSNIVPDRDLQCEIRSESVTIYYRGAALIRNLHLERGRLAGEIHYKYVPLQRPSPRPYVQFASGPSGLEFHAVPAPLPLNDFAPEVLQEYKRMMRSVSFNPEASVIHGIVTRPENQIVDQELKFQRSGENQADKIDICHFDTDQQCIALAEVKGIHDPRLYSRDGEVPEVVEQLRRYRGQIADCRDECIVNAAEACISLKRKLGFGNRLDSTPALSNLRLMKKPVLVIGDCSKEDVRSILNRDSQWVMLMEGLQEEASKLILCGAQGCNLSAPDGSQTHVFDLSCWTNRGERVALKQGDIFQETLENRSGLAVVFGHIGFNEMKSAWKAFARRLELAEDSDPFSGQYGLENPLVIDGQDQKCHVVFIAEEQNHGMSDERLAEWIDEIRRRIQNNGYSRFVTNGVMNVDHGHDPGLNRISEDRRAQCLIRHFSEICESLNVPVTLISMNDVFIRQE